MNTPHINPEPRIRPPGQGQARRIREVDVDDQHSEQREDDAEPQVPETDVRVPGVDLAVAVAVPEEDVLLEDGLFRLACQPFQLL
jgi:hypothetical protein